MGSHGATIRSGMWIAALSGLIFGGAARPIAADEPDLLVAKTPPRTPAEQQAMFHLPPGFRIELVASEPNIVKPINMKFDSAGRLYVTQSFEYPFEAPEGRTGRDTIRRIVDTNGDGVPDAVNVFADGLSIPIGVTPIPAGLFGYSIPKLYRFFDKDGNGVSESRAVAYEGFGHRDTHGMVNGLNYWIDGWIYCCHGFSNTSTVKGRDGSSVTMNSGNTFLVRIDGSHVEQFSFGQVNPFGMTFDARGDMFTADCHSRPATLNLRGGYYQSFGKPDDGLGFAPELMQHSHGSTGIAGVVVYTADRFPPEHQGTVFLGNPVTGRINHDRLQTAGSTHVAVELPDFVSCDDPWFRPVDLQLAADGSIYVADFYNCIIGHYEVPLTHPKRDRERGRIWRISYTPAPNGTAPPRPVDLSRAPVEALVAALSSASLRVRADATHELVDRIGAPALAPIRAVLDSPDSTPEARAHAVWVLFRLGSLDRSRAAKLADDRDALPRLHTVKALAEQVSWQDWQRALVVSKSKDPDPFVRRAAAEALGRHPDPGDVDALLELWRTTDPADTMLVHTTRIALRNVLRAHPELQRLAGRYHESPDSQARLIDVCFGIHTPEAAAFVLALEKARPDVFSRPADCVRYLVKTIDAGRLLDVDRFALAYRGKDRELERTILIDLFRAGHERGIPIPGDVVQWADSVAAACLSDPDASCVQRGIQLVSEAQLGSAKARLLSILAGTQFPQFRGAAAEALASVDASALLPAIRRLVSDPQTPINVRCETVESLRHADNPQSRAFLVELLKVAPSRLAVSIVETLARSREGAVALVDAVEKGHCSARPLGDPGLRGRLQAVGVPGLDARIAKVLEGLPSADERLNKSIAEHARQFHHAKPNAGRGEAVFQRNCAACHQVAGKGNRVGPQLDGAGNRGADRLLEDIIDPNRNVDVNFRATVLALNDGQIVNGLVLREEGPTIVLVDTKGKEQRIAAKNVEQRTASKLSPMPANVVDVMSQQELYDLLAYLLTQRAPGEANR